MASRQIPALSRRHQTPPTLAKCAPALAVIVAALASASVLAACADRPAATVAIPGTRERGRPMTVTHVVDGDTVELRLGDGAIERARLLGIDTPETVKPDTPVECYGPEASARAKALLPDGTPVLVQRDAEARDRFGRLLVYLWRRRDGRFVNRSLVAEGYARTLSIAPNTAHRADLAAAAAVARASGLGLWATCPPSRGP